MRRKGGTKQLDDVDRQLCSLLAADPKTSNRSLAVAIGISDETVAARLRCLREEGVLATTIVVDSEAAGYRAQALVRVRVAGRAFRDVVKPLIDDPATLAITDTSGCCDGVVNVLARNMNDLHHYVTNVLGPLDGIRDLAVDVLVGDLKAANAVLTLPVPQWDPGDLPEPNPTLDDTDLQLLRELQVDGHESNSEVARRLGVSDATVRRRIQRLEDGGLIQIVASIDPITTGDLSAIAFVFVRQTGSTAELVAAVNQRPEVVAGFVCVGASSAILLLGASTDGELTSFASNELPTLPTVRTSEIAFADEVLHHRSHLVRLLRAKAPTVT